MDLPSSVSLPLDDDGFLSQECPSCSRRFKVLPGHDTGKVISHCPYCQHAGQECWWTDPQVEYIEAIMANAVMDEMQKEFKSSGPLKWTSGPRHNPEPPLELSEPSLRVAFVLCNEEIKAEHADELSCIICGKKREG